MRTSRRLLPFLVLSALLGLAAPAPPAPTAAPAVRLLRTQRVGDVTYFHLRFEEPVGRTTAGDSEPRLVPQDGKTRNVCVRSGALIQVPTPDRPFVAKGQPEPPGPAPVLGLE